MSMTTSSIKRLRFRHTQDEKLDCELLTISDLRTRIPQADYGRTTRADFFRLVAVTSGVTKPVIDFSELRATANHWLLIRPGQSMRYDFGRDWSGWMVIFRPESIASTNTSQTRDALDLLARVENMPSQWRLTPQQSTHAQQALDLMHLDYRQSALPQERNALLRYQLAGMLLRLSLWHTHAENPPTADLAALGHFKRFRQLVEADYTRSHQVQHYAKQLGLSDRSLNRACASGAGISAKVFIANRLSLEAKRLLVHTAAPVQNIAFDLGFDEPTNFVKFFKRMEGTTPSSFRNTHTASGN